jgi:phage shock protein A
MRLRAEVTALETEITQIERRLDDLHAERRSTEQQAMTAIEAGDDRAAKAALEELAERADLGAPLEADLTVLRAMASECHRVLETIDAKARTRGAD